MPSWIKTKKDEEKWEKAKNIIKKQYNIDENDESFWPLVTTIYKEIGGIIKKSRLRKLR